MASFDRTANEIVLRVLYDGPPEAGKTTSMRALATSFGQTSVTPEEDAKGRTQWFDWMEYVGGRFEGCRIRCQVVSVPGQRELGHRRRALLATADVVVFVGDSTPGRYEVSLAYLEDLRDLLAGASTPIGIVFQANKRDAEGAAPLEAIRADLGEARWSIGVVESIAADGTGIREAFVYGVRLALDRVRELIGSARLAEGRAAESSADELLALLRAGEHAAAAGEGAHVLALAPAMAGSILDRVLAEDAAAHAGDRAPDVPDGEVVIPGAPGTPDATVPSGAIWPPVEGRAILYEVSRLELRAQRHRNGDWSAGAGTPWRLLSAKAAWFETFEAGRSALVQWARLHAACAPVVSPRRCIVLAATGDGAWRLWQIVRLEDSLRALASTRATAETPEVALDNLCRAAQLLVDINERLGQAPCDLACSLDTIGPTDTAGGAHYIGYLPDLGAPAIAERRPAAALLATELGPLLALDRDVAGERRRALERAVVRIPRGSARADTVVASLFQLLQA